VKFQKGNTGRPKGAQGKLSKTVRETVLNTFLEMQQDPKTNLKAFSKKYPKEFMLIASKLIPQELVGKDGRDLLSGLIVEIIPPKTTEQ
jgi:hypothetical protein